MSTFAVQLRIWNHERPDTVGEVQVLAGTDATFTRISRERLERLGIGPMRRMPFRACDGRVAEREMATVFIATSGYSLLDVVVIAEPGEIEVLGAQTIEGLGFVVDPVQKKLIPKVMWALAAS